MSWIPWDDEFLRQVLSEVKRARCSCPSRVLSPQETICQRLGPFWLSQLGVGGAIGSSGKVRDAAKHPVTDKTVPHLHTHTHKKLSRSNVSGKAIGKFCYIAKSCVFMDTCQIYGKVSHPHFKWSFQNVVLDKTSMFSALISHVCKMGMILCHAFLFSQSSSQRAANECLPSALKILITVIPGLLVQDCRAPGSPADGRYWADGASPVTVVTISPSRRAVSSP